MSMILVPHRIVPNVHWLKSLSRGAPGTWGITPDFDAQVSTYLHATGFSSSNITKFQSEYRCLILPLPI
jgi:hypothetical protein